MRGKGETKKCLYQNEEVVFTLLFEKWPVFICFTIFTNLPKRSRNYALHFMHQTAMTSRLHSNRAHQSVTGFFFKQANKPNSKANRQANTKKNKGVPFSLWWKRHMPAVVVVAIYEKEMKTDVRNKRKIQNNVILKRTGITKFRTRCNQTSLKLLLIFLVCSGNSTNSYLYEEEKKNWEMKFKK